MRAIWILIGLAALGLGALGVVLPLLPTTPFILLAAFAFARSSDRLHAWLLRHKIFGPLIRNWNENGSIGRKAKILSAVSMVAVFGLSVALQVPPIVLIIQAVVLSLAALFVLTRPAPPQQ
ncbi:MAG: YbaN family protein [Pseudomonadota bacterium]